MSRLSQSIRTIRGQVRQRQAQRVAPEEAARECLARFAPATLLGSNRIYSHESPVDCSGLAYPGHEAAQQTRLRSSLCTGEQLGSAAFRHWAQEIEQGFRYHRKLWEFCFVLQSLYERDMLRPGRRGLGFAVGEEPLPAYMASRGCQVLASDLDASDERADVWAQTAQLASTLESLNKHQLCEPERFQELVAFRPIDMNRIPPDITGFDFTWSSCSFEHCGSIGLGKRFLREQMKCLKPGGVAVHTTEYNLSSVEETVEEGATVIFRRQDIEGVVRDLLADGHQVEPLQLDLGSTAQDQHIDLFPYSDDPHLKLELFEEYVSTSIGLIITKSLD